MKLIKGKKYQYENIELIFEEKLEDFCYMNCDKCSKDTKNPYFFLEANPGTHDPSEYYFGSECIKKCIKEIK